MNKSKELPPKALPDLSLLSLNVRGIKNFKKRRTVFNWARHKNPDIILLQETHSELSDETHWKREWGGNAIFSHGSNNSCGVCILFRNGLDIEIKQVITDRLGRYIFLDISVHSKPFYLINIYAPNKVKEQTIFFKKLDSFLNGKVIELNTNIIMGGDFNITLVPEKDKKGGNIGPPNSANHELHKVIDNLELLDIWRRCHPNKHGFTWRRNTPPIQCRLDYWLTSEPLSNLVLKTSIIPAILTDHNAIFLEMNTNSESESRGRGFWKMNTLFLQKNEFLNQMKQKLEEWKGININSASLKWDYLKFKIREFTMSYCRDFWKKSKEKETLLENQYKEMSLEYAENPTNELMESIDQKKKELEEFYEIKTQGNIIRSRARWHEQGEKSSKYFLNLEKRNQIRKNIRSLNVNNTTITNPKDILNEEAKYYQSLYTSKMVFQENDFEKFTENLIIPKLTEEEKNSCEGLISNGECQKVIKNMKNNKSPGNDGIPVEFYKIFWPNIGKLVIECFNESYANGSLSTSQKQAVITLIDKPGKDLTLLKNWRPISLLNTDYKIATKVLAMRLQKVLPNIIHHNQTGFVHNRYIGDSIRSILDVIEFTKLKNIPGILLALDFEKAFDSLEWKYLNHVLLKYNFGNSFLQWIKTFYNGASSCMINNGHTSNYFKLGRGVRQGDPISPYLFLLAIEILAIKIRADEHIKGIKLYGHESKVIAHADDITSLLQDVQSAKNLFKIIQSFSRFSGLILNKSKCEGMWLGSLHSSTDKPLGVNWSNAPIRILGIFISHDSKKMIEFNLQNKITSIQKLFRSWSLRGLSLLGRVTIAKTLAISQFIFAASVISVSKDILKKVNSCIYNFLWNGGSEKIKREVLNSEHSKGGLKMLDLNTMINANRIMWVKRFLDPNIKASWKSYLEGTFCSHGGVNLLCNANYNAVHLKCNREIPEFYMEMMSCWKLVSIPCESLLWHSPLFKLNGKGFFWKEFNEAGINHVSDLFENQQPIPFVTLSGNKPAISRSVIKWLGLISLIPKESRSLKCNSCTNLFDQMKINIGKIVHLKTVDSKQIYQYLNNKKNVIPTGSNKISTWFGKHFDHIEWETIYLRPLQAATESYIRCFQYKILHNITAVRHNLFKWKILPSPYCRFCDTENETILHLFTKCRVAIEFWISLERYYENITNKSIDLTPEKILLGVEGDIWLNYLLILGKYFLFKADATEGTHFKYFDNIVKSKYSVEKAIALGNNSIGKLLNKWEPYIKKYGM